MLALVPAARAQEPRRAAPSEPAPAREDISALLEPVRAKNDVPALAGAIVHGANVVAIGATGVRARGHDEKVTIDDQWHMGSCTKAMTATLAAKLVEQGKLKWSTTVGEVFKDAYEDMHPDWRNVPIEWLLQNRGGAPGNCPPQLWSDLWKRSDATNEFECRWWFVGELLKSAPQEKPGTKFVYSNQGFTIAGAMLERITSRPWNDLIRDYVFEPLGMSSAGFGAPGSSNSIDQPWGHTASGPMTPGMQADNPPAIGPAGTVHCSIGDWAKFVAAHMQGENGVDGIVKAASFRKLHEAPEFQTYAMGWVREPRKWAGGDTFSHSGSNTMWYCVVWIAPAKDYAFLATTNIGGDAASKACDEAVQAMLKRVKLLE